MAKGMVTIMVVPVEGETVRREVRLTAGMTVAQALAAAGVGSENKNLSVTRMATGTDPAAEGDVITVSEADQRKLTAGETVRVTERPRGS